MKPGVGHWTRLMQMIAVPVVVGLAGGCASTVKAEDEAGLQQDTEHRAAQAREVSVEQCQNELRDFMGPLARLDRYVWTQRTTGSLSFNHMLRVHDMLEEVEPYPWQLMDSLAPFCNRAERLAEDSLRAFQRGFDAWDSCAFKESCDIDARYQQAMTPPWDRARELFGTASDTMLGRGVDPAEM